MAEECCGSVSHVRVYQHAGNDLVSIERHAISIVTKLSLAIAFHGEMWHFRPIDTGITGRVQPAALTESLFGQLFDFVGLWTWQLVFQFY